MALDLVTIASVPVLRTGHYELASGPVDFASEHLAAAVQAFENDPAVLAPRIRVELDDRSHLDDEGIAVEASGGQGGPALGWVDGLRAEGDTLYGDLHIPAELADVIEWAYPARSIEGLFGYTTATGHTHDFLMTGLCLLGVTWPGVTTLPDLRELESEFAESVAAAGAETFAIRPPQPVRTAAVVARMPTESHVQAGLSVGDLRLRWYAAEADGSLTGLPDSYDFWSWYVSEVRVDDDGSLFTLVVDEATGRLWRFDETVNGSEVTFAEPYEVVQQFVAASGRPGPRPRPAIAAWHSRAESRASASNPNPEEESSPMTEDQRRNLARGLGMPEDSTEEALHTEAARRAENPETPAPEPEPEPEPAPEDEVGPEAMAASSRTVTVSREVWEATQRQAADGATARAEQVRAERDRLVQAAIDDGRITPAEAGMARNGQGELADGWRRDMDEAPEVTARALDRLERGKYPGATGRLSTVADGARGNSLQRVLAASGLNRDQSQEVIRRG